MLFFTIKSSVAALLIACGAVGGVRAEGPESRSIASLESIDLNGVRQTILMRGENRRNPILLFLHGGPGSTEMPYEWVNRALERDFTIVHWDQRGAGKSYDPHLPCSELRVSNFVRDAHSLTCYLLRRFGQEKLFLVGHSWGSLLGVLTVARYPDLFFAYVGISQFVNVSDSQRILYDTGVTVARADEKTAALGKLLEIGPPPFKNHIVERQADGIEKELSDRAAHQMTRAHFASLALLSPEYSLADDVRMLLGIPRIGRCLEKEIYTANLLRAVPEIDVPAFFFEGRYDTVLSPALVERYYRDLTAPHGKRLVWFEHSDHWLQLEEREKYRMALRECLLGKSE